MENSVNKESDYLAPTLYTATRWCEFSQPKLELYIIIAAGATARFSCIPWTWYYRSVLSPSFLYHPYIPSFNIILYTCIHVLLVHARVKNGITCVRAVHIQCTCTCMFGEMCMQNNCTIVHVHVCLWNVHAKNLYNRTCTMYMYTLSSGQRHCWCRKVATTGIPPTCLMAFCAMSALGCLLVICLRAHMAGSMMSSRPPALLMACSRAWQRWSRHTWIKYLWGGTESVCHLTWALYTCSSIIHVWAWCCIQCTCTCSLVIH